MRIKISTQTFLVLVLFYAVTVSAQKWQETFLDPAIPSGWQVIDEDESDKGLGLFSSKIPEGGQLVTAHSGNCFWYSDLDNANLAGEINEWLISPQISVIYSHADVDSIPSDSLIFWAGAKGGPFADSLRVMVSTTDDQMSSFTHLLGHFKVKGPDDSGIWHKYSYDLSQFDSMDIYFAINYYIKDGGPGGANSDAVWIDNFSISGNPSDFNLAPVKFSLLDPPNFSFLHPAADTTINFKWYSSFNADGDPLIYTLEILDIFPVKKFQITNDTTFAFTWPNILEDYAAFRWTVKVTDGKSTVFSPDTFIFITPPNEDLAPSEFSLLYPEGGDTVSLSASTLFEWRESFDINYDTLFYELNIFGNGLDTTFSGLNDTTCILFCGNFLESNTSYKWRVFACDSIHKTQSSSTWSLRTAILTNLANSAFQYPAGFDLKQNYPNPFNGTTIIEYGIPEDQKVDLSIYNTLGQKVFTVVNQRQEARRYKVSFDAVEAGLTSGLYFYQVKAGDYIKRRKFVFIK